MPSHVGVQHTLVLCVGARWACGGPDGRARMGAQDALGVEEGEVEVWVVRAIGKKLLEARIDQMRRTVAVTKCMQRTFSTAQWRALLAQLGAWKVCPGFRANPQTLKSGMECGRLGVIEGSHDLSQEHKRCMRDVRPVRLALCRALVGAACAAGRLHGAPLGC